MSRVGKRIIQIPQTVEVKLEGDKIIVKGPRGEISRIIRPEVKVEIKENKIFVFPTSETKKTREIWGTTNVLISNMIKGVVGGFEKKLELVGIGFKAELKNNNLLLYVGFSHPVEIKNLPGINFSIEKNIITVSGIDKELVGQTAAVIRKIRPPEPYKSKGIRYLGEVIRKKVGKKAVTAK